MVVVAMGFGSIGDAIWWYVQYQMGFGCGGARITLGHGGGWGKRFGRSESRRCAAMRPWMTFGRLWGCPDSVVMMWLWYNDGDADLVVGVPVAMAKYQKNVEAHHNKSGMKPNIVPNCIRSESYMITFEVEEEKFPCFGKKYQLKLANDISAETHCLVHFPSLIRLSIILLSDPSTKYISMTCQLKTLPWSLLSESGLLQI
ncbi:hypothetical protein RJ639_037308 [Escallonia herrerae]|uniref:Uncharacterized protein n=1 Tax=Escallonia herrerae TaxID=1293975 RepID=A0AA88WNQ6_9ASTE|nr:hypothetical protein RJ639_037308 [Escallonia herrerae]